MSNTQLTIKSNPKALAFKGLLEGKQFQSALSQTLPRHVSPARIIRVTLSAFQQRPKILECSPESVMLSLLRSAAMGLEPDGGPLGQGYLVPFWSGKNKRYECQFIPGYRGLVKLARNSGEIADVWAEVVYESDEFDYELGLEQKLRHKRNDAADDPGPLKFAYAVARFRDGEKKFVVMNRREVEKVKASSSSKNEQGEVVGPWREWEEEMWKKTAVRRLCKLLPLSVEVAQQIGAEDSDAPIPAVTIDVPQIAGEPAESGPAASTDPHEETAEAAREAVTDQSPPPAVDWAEIETRLAEADTLTKVSQVGRDYSTRLEGDDEFKLAERVEARSAEIRAARGERSNKDKQKELV